MDSFEEMALRVGRECFPENERFPYKEAVINFARRLRAEWMAQEPVAFVAEVYQSRYTIELNGHDLAEGMPLYAKPAAQGAPEAQVVVHQGRLCVRPIDETANAFWQYWRENGETHKHGYYESTWGAINAALNAAAPNAAQENGRDGVDSPRAAAPDIERDAKRWQTIELLWFAGQVTLDCDDNGMFRIDFEGAENTYAVWTGIDQEGAVDAAIEAVEKEGKQR